MKKILILVALLIVMIPAVHAAEAPAAETPSIETNNLTNGHAFDTDKTEAEAFTIGCIETLNYLRRNSMATLYPARTYGEILEIVKKYYQANPAKKSRPIVEVLLAGAK